MTQLLSMLTETSHQIEVLHENTTSGNKLYIEGIFAEAELKNGNGRWYGQGILEQAVDSYNRDFVFKRRAVGELNHPDYPLPNIQEAAILIESLEMRGSKAFGKALVLNTPKGKIIEGLLEGGFNMGVSTRGLGAIKERGGIRYVQEGFMLTAVDCVDMPSGPNCYVNPLKESMSRWVMKNGVLVEVETGEIVEGLDESLLLKNFSEFFKTL